jgi:predicted TIM-barrel fold metal-dependent hydrolase
MVIDSHAHIYPEKIAEKATKNIGDFYGLPMYAGTGTSAELIKMGKQAGVDKFLVCSVATVMEQTHTINNYIKTECDLHSEFFGFGAFHQDCDVSEVEHILELGLKGVKIHPDFQKTAIDDPKFFKLYEAIQGRLPILIHMGDDRFDYSHPARLANVLQTFPDLQVIAAHLGGYQLWDVALEKLARFVQYGNLKFDECSSLAILPPEKARDIIRTYGTENVFFGVDFPMWSHQDERMRLESLGFSTTELEQIYSRNIIKFLGLEF